MFGFQSMVGGAQVKGLKRDDRGQVTTALVIIGTVLVVALGMLATKLGQATDQKSQVQSAADAAALAGAPRIRPDAPGPIVLAIKSGGEADFTRGLGQPAAAAMANVRGARSRRCRR